MLRLHAFNPIRVNLFRDHDGRRWMTNSRHAEATAGDQTDPVKLGADCDARGALRSPGRPAGGRRPRRRARVLTARLEGFTHPLATAVLDLVVGDLDLAGVA